MGRGAAAEARLGSDRTASQTSSFSLPRALIKVSLLHPDNVFDRFSDNVPNAHEHGEVYLRGISQCAREAQLPVTADVAEQTVGGGLRPEKALFLVLTPTHRRLRRYPSYHFARPVGTALNVGWY